MMNFVLNRKTIQFKASNHYVKTIVTQNVCSDEPRLLGGVRFMGEFKGDAFVIWRSSARSNESALKIYGSFDKGHKYCELPLEVSRNFSTLIFGELLIFSFMLLLVICNWLMPMSESIKIGDVLGIFAISQAILASTLLYEKLLESKFIISDFEDEIQRFLHKPNEKPYEL